MLHPQATLEAGQGAVHVERAFAGRSTFKQLAFCYPLKLMPPKISASEAKLGASLLCLYMLTYGGLHSSMSTDILTDHLSAGGGLVAGDTVNLQVQVDSDCHLVLLTQGNTKVFKDRPGGSYATMHGSSGRAASSLSAGSSNNTATRQRMRVRIQQNASIILLPAPVACFKDASYSQHQTFELQDPTTSSLLLLDWFTSGRQSRGENWQFERYRSRNEVIIDGRTIINDVLLLECEAFGKRMAHFTCYCNLFICGQALTSLSEHFRQLSQDETQYQQAATKDLIWSYSELEKDRAAVVRCAGIETEIIKDWLAQQLKTLEILIGRDIYKAAFV